MGLLDNLEGLLQGSGSGVEPVELAAGEREIFRTPGSVGSNGLSFVGGDLVVTDQRLLFTPLNTRDVAALLQAGLKRAGAPGKSTVLVGRIQRHVSESGTTSVVHTIREGRDASLVRPPSVVVTGVDGHTHEFGVLATRRSANLSPDNRVARQRLIEAVNATLTTRTDSGLPASPSQVGGAPTLPRPAAPRISVPSRGTRSSVALTDEEIEANAELHEETNGSLRMYFPLARARSNAARLDAALAGRWDFADLGVLTLDGAGHLQGTLQLFGALPPGPANGDWWIDGTPETLVVNLVCVQTERDVRAECAMSWPLILLSVTQSAITTEVDGEPFTLRRL